MSLSTFEKEIKKHFAARNFRYRRGNTEIPPVTSFSADVYLTRFGGWIEVRFSNASNDAGIWSISVDDLLDGADKVKVTGVKGAKQAIADFIIRYRVLSDEKEAAVE